MPPRVLADEGYTLGMIRDFPSWKIPNGGVYDSLNMLNDQPGILRQRMGSTAIWSGTQTQFFYTSLGFAYAADASQIEALYGYDGKTGNLHIVDFAGSGGISFTASPIGISGIVGRAVRHFGFCVFPINANAQVAHGSVVAAGYAGITTFTNTVASSLVAGDPRITLTGADTTTNVKAGTVVLASCTGGNVYWGRVVTVDTSKIFTVWPVPTFSDTIGIGSLITRLAISSGGGCCATSFQNRLLYGNTNDLGSSQPLRNDRRIVYSVLPTEASGVRYGASFVDANTWPKLNYITIPGSDPIVAMEPISDNQLLILTTNQPVIFTGDLITYPDATIVSPTITWDESAILQPAGCLSDQSVQRTSRGIVWAGAGGVYAYGGGSKIEDLTKNRISTYWKQLSLGANFAIHGAAYVRDHYIVSGSSGGVTFSLACNMTNLQWTRLSGVGTDIFGGVEQPSNRARVFVGRWWNQAGATPTHTNGQTLRLETMFSPYVATATTTDGDGSAVPMSVQTKTITGDAETQKTFVRGTVRSQQASATAAVAVTGQSTIAAEDVAASRTRALGSLSNTETRTITNATNANPIVVTTSAVHGLQDEDFVDIDGVTGNTNANGRWRIDVLSTTTFSLVGGIGNGAFGGSPTCKKVTETDFTMTPINKGQGISIGVSGSPNNFEFHGVRVLTLDGPQVGSS